MQGLRLGGHPLHPALVHFPVVGWTLAPAFDGLALATHEPTWWHCSWWSLAGGALMALPAMLAGFMDLIALPAEHPGQDTAQRHMLLMGSAWSVSVLDLVMRPLHTTPEGNAIWLDLGLSFTGFVLLAAGAYAGGRLVYDFGIGQSGKSQH